jgi:hypothetical protein
VSNSAKNVCTSAYTERKAFFSRPLGGAGWDTPALQAAEKLKTEGVEGFSPRKKPTESQVALATEGQFSSIPPKFPCFSATRVARMDDQAAAPGSLRLIYEVDWLSGRDLVSAGLMSVGITIVVASVLVLWGMRKEVSR